MAFKTTMAPDHWQRLSESFIAGLWLLVITTAALSEGGWRLLRTANPGGGNDAVSMTRSADISSDRDLAGLMLRCHEARAEVAVVVITPFPPRAQPEISLAAAGKEWHFQARIVPPGAELLLPQPAADLAAGAWQSSNQLSVKIAWQDRSVAGVIPIDGLRSALATLIANCPRS